MLYGNISPAALEIAAEALIALVTVLGVRRYYIRRSADTTDRELLSSDETRFRETLIHRLEAESGRIDGLVSELANVRIELGTVTGQRNAAVARAERAEADAERLEKKVDLQNARIGELEEQVRLLKGQLLARGETGRTARTRTTDNPLERP